MLSVCLSVCPLRLVRETDTILSYHRPAPPNRPDMHMHMHAHAHAHVHVHVHVHVDRFRRAVGAAIRLRAAGDGT